jgi:hypothetical protein
MSVANNGDDHTTLFSPQSSSQRLAMLRQRASRVPLEPDDFRPDHQVIRSEI